MRYALGAISCNLVQPGPDLTPRPYYPDTLIPNSGSLALT